MKTDSIKKYGIVTILAVLIWGCSSPTKTYNRGKYEDAIKTLDNHLPFFYYLCGTMYIIPHFYINFF